MFELHVQLAKDCVVVGDLPLCRVLLMNDRRFPWLILVPRREETVEVFQLSTMDQRTLWEEVGAVAAALASDARADKMNIGALGNVVPQLHVHVIARFQGDAAWPGPVWGSGSAEHFDDDTLEAKRQEFVDVLAPLSLEDRRH